MADDAVTPVGDAAAVLPVTEGAETAGLPQLDFSSFPNQIFWLVVALGATYLILSRIALPRVASVLAERQGQITGDLAAAEDLKADAERAEETYERALKDARAEAQDIVAAARAEIQGELDEAVADAEAEIAARTAEGEAEIAAIRDSARDSVGEVARDTAAALVSAIGVEADRAQIDAAVGRQLEDRA